MKCYYYNDSNGGETKARLTDVNFAENLERNLFCKDCWRVKGVKYHRGQYRVIAKLNEVPAVFNVRIRNNLMGVTAQKCEQDTTGRDVLMSVLAQHEEDVGQDVEKGSLIHFHKRLANFKYDTITKMAKDPASGIQLTDELRANCLACAQGKQTKNPQSRKDSGTNAPIDAIGGLIFSDFKGTMTPRDRLGTRYMVNLSTIRQITVAFSWRSPRMLHLKSLSAS